MQARAYAALRSHCTALARYARLKGERLRGERFGSAAFDRGAFWERSFTVQSTAPTGAHFHTAQRSVVKKERSAENRSVIAVQSKCKYSAV